jgi:hypothetical protein
VVALAVVAAVSDGTMSFLDHLEELRKRLMISIAALFVGVLAAYTFVDTRATRVANAPAPLVEGRYTGGNDERRYDVAPDGRFLMLTFAELAAGDETAGRRFVAVVNWPEELKRLVPIN